MLTHAQVVSARKRAAELLDRAGIVLTTKEQETIEVADFGLSGFAMFFMQGASSSKPSQIPPSRQNS